MDTNKFVVVEILYSDGVECCDGDSVACLDEGVVAYFDKNNKDSFDVYFFLSHPLG